MFVVVYSLRSMLLGVCCKHIITPTPNATQTQPQRNLKRTLKNPKKLSFCVSLMSLLGVWVVSMCRICRLLFVICRCVAYVVRLLYVLLYVLLGGCGYLSLCVVYVVLCYYMFATPQQTIWKTWNARKNDTNDTSTHMTQRTIYNASDVSNTNKPPTKNDTNKTLGLFVSFTSFCIICVAMCCLQTRQRTTHRQIQQYITTPNKQINKHQ